MGIDRPSEVPQLDVETDRGTPVGSLAEGLALPYGIACLDGGGEGPGQDNLSSRRGLKDHRLAPAFKGAGKQDIATGGSPDRKVG